MNVNSAFLVALEKQKRERATQGTSRGKKYMTSIWKRTWKLRINAKMKHFIWKCWFKLLATTDKLASKGITTDLICKVCGEVEENLEHLLFRCRREKKVWLLAPVNWEEKWTEVGCFADWWELLCRLKIKVTTDHIIEIPFFILWQLWKARNLWYFSNVWMNETEILHLAMLSWNENVNHLEKLHLDGGKSKNTETEGGNLNLLEDCLDCNHGIGHHFICVSFTRDRNLGIGLRGLMGMKESEEQHAWNLFDESCRNDDEALLLGIKQALKHVSLLNWREITILIDNKEIIGKLRVGSTFGQSLLTISEDIYLILNSFSCCNFNFGLFKSDDINVILANLALASGFGHHWQAPFPSWNDLFL